MNLSITPNYTSARSQSNSNVKNNQTSFGMAWKVDASTLRKASNTELTRVNGMLKEVGQDLNTITAGCFTKISGIMHEGKLSGLKIDTVPDTRNMNLGDKLRCYFSGIIRIPEDSRELSQTVSLDNNNAYILAQTKKSVEASRRVFGASIPEIKASLPNCNT